LQGLGEENRKLANLPGGLDMEWVSRSKRRRYLKTFIYHTPCVFPNIEAILSIGAFVLWDEETSAQLFQNSVE